MAEATMTQILDDLRAADEITRRLERRYWLSSADFYDLYRQGVLDAAEQRIQATGGISHEDIWNTIEAAEEV